MVLDRGYTVPLEELVLLKKEDMIQKGYESRFTEEQLGLMTGNRRKYLEEYIIPKRLPLVEKQLAKSGNGKDYRQAMNQSYVAPDGRTLLVKYTPGISGSAPPQLAAISKKKEKLKVNIVDSFVFEFKGKGYTEAILISDLPLSEVNLEKIREATQEKRTQHRSWVFLDNELRLNPNNHQLSVPHTTLSRDTVPEFPEECRSQ